jgi:hypothetical protein
MTTETILILLMILFIVGVFPAWPHSKSWGYKPTSALALVLVIFFIWILADGRPLFRSSGQDLRGTMQDAGQDIKAAGRDVADSLKRSVN